jgi:tRNA nucleotidyltransferase/poly(A) polymerase
VLELFPRAVATGWRHGTVMVPTAAGPVDVTSFRGGPRLLDDLAHRDFTLNAMAYDPCAEVLFDPFDGRGDLAKGRLRAVGDAEERFAEDPLRALRAVRLAATLDLEVEPAIVRAMAGAREGLRRVARERVRHELCLTLLAPGISAGLALLRRTGLEPELAPGAAADAAEVLPLLPPDLELRLAGWLRGARAVAILRRLRFSRRSVERVERLLHAHPIELGVEPERDASVRRQCRRVGEGNVGALIALRRAELARGAAAGAPDADACRARLAALEEAIGRVGRAGRIALARHDLAIDGAEVMQRLGTGPGPHVGRALAYLTDRVVDDPSLNTPEALRRLLDAWVQAGEG